MISMWLVVALTAAPEEVPKVADLQAQVEALRKELQSQRQLLISLLRSQQQTSTELIKWLETTQEPMASSAAPALIPPPPVTIGEPIAGPRGKAPQGKLSVSGRVVRSNGTVPEGAWVFVKDIRSKTKAELEIKQQNKVFVPSVAAVQVGTKLKFPNFDAVFHDVFSRSPGNSFDLGPTQGGDAAKSVIATSPGVIEIFCNFHSKMNARILVVPGPVFTQADASGRFVLKNLPAGKHTLVAWAPGAREEALTLEVTSDLTDVTLELNPGADRQHLNKSGLPYGSYGD